MTVRDLIGQDIDIDVYDDVTEELAIAFCGPLRLTEQGAEHFAEVLDYDMKMINVSYGALCIVKIDDPSSKVWKHKLRKAKEFFEAAAGYCTDSDYQKWFEEG